MKFFYLFLLLQLILQCSIDREILAVYARSCGIDYDIVYDKVDVVVACGDSVFYNRSNLYVLVFTADSEGSFIED